MAIQATEEITDWTGTDITSRAVSLGLNINPIEAKGVLVNHSVNTIVAGTAKGTPCFIGARPAVTHTDKEIDYQAFKKLRWGGSNPVKNFASKSGIYLAVRPPHNFVGCVCPTARS